ncbi:hypothetical protein [Azospirillum sp. TSO35-2]|uniref:hypothetical protein n=1 Tax=Azospirillum sp. TSO35-2 TaxID=716796 RepID=UPI000D65A984|nr:hypothetical protein [Azospirillum sp. TSO35-2]
MATVRTQTARALGDSGGLAGASDAQKQELAEALLVQATLIDVAMMELAGNGFVPAFRQNP